MDFNFKHFNPRNLLLKLSTIGKYFLHGGIKIPLRVIWMIMVICCILYFFFVASPVRFPVGSIVEIKEGLTTKEIAQSLEDKKVIKSKLLFETIVRVFRGDKGVRSGDYFFERHKNVFTLSYRTIKGVFGLTPIRVTVFEGLTISEMAEFFANKLDNFDENNFILQAQEKEGYLFPDTYYFLPNINEDGIITAMENNFYERIGEVQEQIDVSGYTLHEIITMASILEEEGITFHDRKMMSGVLWNRINIDMPLQVDAVFPYIIGKNTYQVSLEDLKNESPYNTYKYKGLPPGPITNPGFNAIVATLEPIEHNYLYYLSDRQHNTYYAETFEGHKQNRVLYLRK